MEQVPREQGAEDGVRSCYRHPERETGISCTRCERPICPECMVSASVGFQCPECVRTGSGTGHAPAASRPRNVVGAAVTGGDPQLVTKILIGVNLAVFLVVLAGGDRIVTQFGLLGDWPFSSEGVADGQYYRLLTSVFLHQQIMHIAFNMLSLWWIGGPLEAALGRARYLALYLLSGLAGSALTYVLAEPTQFSLGASGAVFGLFGATGVLMRRMRYDMRPFVALLALNLLFTFTWSNIAWQAHIGGLVAGFVIAVAMLHAPRERREAFTYGACGLVFLVTLGMVVMRTVALT